MRLPSVTLNLLVLTTTIGYVSAAAEPLVVPLEPAYHFAITGMSEPVEHVFHFRNNSQQTVEMARIMVTPPLVVPNVSARVRPGEEGMLKFRMGDPRPVGEYEGMIQLEFKNAGIGSISFDVLGTITPTIEGKPFPAFFVATSRGHPKDAKIELINHAQEPLQIEALEYASQRFTLRLETNQPGQRYSLVLSLRGEGPTGRATEAIALRTSSEKEPVLRIPANTLVYERVHTFPDEVDFGRVEAEQARDERIRGKFPTQRLMVYQEGGTNLEVTATCELPFVQVQAQRSKTGKQVQLNVTLLPEHLNPGPFEGQIHLVTNDREFSQFDIPIRGEVHD